jgi:hypothetical protein
MRRALAVVLAVGLAACRGAAAPPLPSPSSLGCEIVVTHSADGRSGTAGCTPSASPSPRVAGTQEPPKEQKGKGKGRD